MDVRQLSPFISITPQINPTDIGLAASLGFQTIICNRPANESKDQPDHRLLAEACERLGLAWHYLPVEAGKITDADVTKFSSLLHEVQGPALAFCLSGTRSATLWALSQAPRLDVNAIIKATAQAGYDLEPQRQRLIAAANQPDTQPINASRQHDILIVGGGAGGQAAAASLLKRQPDLDIAIVDPSSEHYYQPGWTLVGGGVFNRKDTVRHMSDMMHPSCHWYQAAVSHFEPDQQQLALEDGERIGYRILIVAPGLTLDWDAISGLRENLGSNGVTSNYQFDMAPYTWELIQNCKAGKALFTQPPMPIKCAGAPQKAMYLACDHWLRSGQLSNIDVEFCNAGPGLFGVADYVPALMEYVEKYAIQLQFQHTLTSIDGSAKTAKFNVNNADGEIQEVEKSFDMIHVCPPQKAPQFISNSPLADTSGWLDLDPETLQHNNYGDIFGLGDASNTPNAKTAAAVRKQAPVVAENVLMALKGEAPKAIYAGYGSCPLTVEKGKIVLAEFGYGGKLQPSFPTWLVQGTRPSRLSWFLKEKMLPWIYWNAMLKGKEWLAQPEILSHRPARHEAAEALEK